MRRAAFGPLLLLSACTSGRESPLVRLEASAFRFSAIDTVSAGPVRIRLVNRDPVWHEASVIRVSDSAATIADYIKAVQGGDEYPAFAHDVGGVGLLAPGDSADVVLMLPAGRYAILCWHQDHLLQGMSTMLQVIADDRQAVPPITTDSVVLTDTGISPVAPGAGRRLLHVRNDGPNEHELVILALDAGRSLDEWLAWRKAGEVGPAPGRTIGGTAALAPGREAWVDVSWTPGRYEMICLLTDSTGAELVHRGMQRTIEIRD